VGFRNAGDNAIGGAYANSDCAAREKIMSLKILNENAFKHKPKAVIFDTDNTLYAYDPTHQSAMEVTCQKACELLSIGKKEFYSHYTLARKAVKERLGDTASSHSRLLYFQAMIEALGLKTQLLLTLDLTQTYWSAYLSAIKTFPDIKEFVLELKNAGVATAIITDLTAEIQFRKIIFFGLENFFDYVVTSEEAGVDKPDMKIFNLALQKLGVNRNEIWMIGDNPISDIQGGRDAGMVTLQKRHEGVIVKNGDDAPDLIFDHFKELRRIINGKNWEVLS
jgi:HAD superfamily hydrolase (TIGR01549 family)